MYECGLHACTHRVRNPVYAVGNGLSDATAATAAALGTAAVSGLRPRCMPLCPSAGAAAWHASVSVDNPLGSRAAAAPLIGTAVTSQAVRMLGRFIRHVPAIGEVYAQLEDRWVASWHCCSCRWHCHHRRRQVQSWCSATVATLSQDSPLSQAEYRHCH